MTWVNTASAREDQQPRPEVASELLVLVETGYEREEEPMTDPSKVRLADLASDGAVIRWRQGAAGSPCRDPALRWRALTPRFRRLWTALEAPPIGQ